MMTTDEIKRRCLDAAKVRMPTLDKDATTGFQIEQMQDYMLTTAQWRGDLEEARLYAEMAYKVLKDEFEKIPEEQYQPFVNGTSLAAVTRARAKVRPDLADGIADARWHIDRLGQQISRLELDAQWASRIYTMLTGG